MMKKLACALFAALLLAGCAVPVPETPAEPPANPPADEATPVYSIPYTAEPMALLSPMGDPNPATTGVAEGANQFAFRLTKALLEEQPDPDASFVCSPYSVWMPLAALVNATEGSEREALLAALSAGGLDADDVNEAASRMLYSLTNEAERQWAEEYLAEQEAEAARAAEQGLEAPEALDPADYAVHNPLTIANAIFTSETLDPDFAKAFMDYYRGTAMEVDFTSPDAVEAVNAWANEHTNGLIPEIVREFDPKTIAAIANAIYFSDRWEWEFDPAETEAMPFHGAKEEQESQFMRREGDYLGYYEDDELQAMPLRFKTSGGLMILLPKDGDATAMMQNMTDARFAEIQEGVSEHKGLLKLPKFKLASNLTLKDSLEALGVELFDADTLPLTRLFAETPAYLTSAVQKALIEVDEKGTTAAAVTVMAAAGAAAPPEPTEPFEMICDRPFGFVLYAHTYDGGSQVLFTGVVNGL